MKFVLENNNLTGWQTFPIKIFDKQKREIVGYHDLSITGICGPVDWNRSEIIEKRLVPTGPFGKYYKGLYIALDQWGKSDFFLPKNYAGIIVSSKAADVLKKK
ncbi:MAG: hypothetical protein P4L16_01360 [Chlamydiales bacterium]|nr:hypothetical protein [Chlamydiales bacterium]